MFIENKDTGISHFEGNRRLMFITHRTTAYSEYDQVEKALQGGCEWIQLRIKNTLDLDTARAIRELCTRYGSERMLCIDDDIEIALQSNAQAVHLGKNDLPVREAWKQVEKSGKQGKFLIGATANTFDDIRRAAAEGASYIGLGPYRFTETKQNLSPVLGLEGYCTILEQCREAGLRIPVFAIGGIMPEDVAPLMQTGITGIAVSGAILRDADPAGAIRRFLNEINTY